MSDRNTFESTLLGLLYEGPCHGYDLAEHFAGEGDLSAVALLGRSNVYSLLQALECRGEVTRSLAPGHGGPMKTVFSLTESGRSRFLEWVALPVSSVRDLRIQFVLKIHFLTRLNLCGREELTAAQLGILETRLGELAGRRALAEEAAGLVLGLQEELLKGAISWLHRLLKDGTASFYGRNAPA